jgi:hypothetical protein
VKHPVPVILGHIFLIATLFMYSTYWVMDYYAAGRFMTLEALLFSGSILIGLAGLMLFFVFTGARNWPILLTGVVLFILSLIIMDKVFQRQFTSEIFFAFLWAISEMNIVYAVYKSGGIAKTPFFIIASGVLACTAINLACYRVHLQLEGFDRFFNGIIPYLAATIFMTAVLIVLFLNKKFTADSRP